MLRRIRIRPLYRKQKISPTLIYRLLFGVVVLVVVGFLFSTALFAFYSRQLPSPGKLNQQSNNSTVFYDQKGKIIYEMYKDKNRVPVSYSDISKNLINATVAIEDKTFFKHQGFSQIGILRSIFNLILKRRLEGGSTITQQLIKTVLLSSERTLPRKIKEAMLSISVENKYSKQQILEMYLNEIPYGGTYWGIGSASQGYFEKSPKDLSLVEAAVLAGLPQNPSVYSPFIGVKNAWKTRALDVLRRMREDGDITSATEKIAKTDLNKITFSKPKEVITAPHFIFYLKKELEKQYGGGIIDKGLKIYTTIDLKAQTEIEKIVKDEINKIKEDYQVGNGSALVLDSQTGAILAWVGSYDFNNEEYGKYDVVSLGQRQPGSTLKPFIYALALEKGYTASTVLMDVKTNFTPDGKEEYIPKNYDGKFRGPIQMRFALGNSINIPAVKMLAMLGMHDFLQKTFDMGLATLAPTDTNIKRFGLSISLGGGEVSLLDLTNAYSVFARGGTKKTSYGIEKITDFKNKVIFQNRTSREDKVLSTEASYIISHILSDNNARIDTFGPRSYLNVPGRTVSVKTGTTNDKRDNWTVGYTKGVTVGVWVGNNDNSKMNPKIASGATGASPIWYEIMRNLLTRYQDGLMDKPDNVEALTIDAYLGGLPKGGYPNRSEYFIKGSEPKDVASYYKKLKISKSNGKLANEFEIKSGNFEEKDFIVFQENDLLSNDGKNRWQEAVDSWAAEQKDDKYHAPKETSDASNESVMVSIKNPSDHQKLDDNNVNIKAKITSMEKIKNVKIYINNNEIKSWNEDKKDVDETINLSDGTYEIVVKAWNEKDKNGESSIKIGVKKEWDYQVLTTTPTETPVPIP